MGMDSKIRMVFLEEFLESLTKRLYPRQSQRLHKKDISTERLNFRNQILVTVFQYQKIKLQKSPVYMPVIIHYYRSHPESSSQGIQNLKYLSHRKVSPLLIIPDIFIFFRINSEKTEVIQHQGNLFGRIEHHDINDGK
jgi:hypothetical protein